jgi:tetrahydromethanopterin S-methyltransferase subunit B
MNDCPQGIKNEKEIEKLGDKFAIMFEQLDKGIDKLNQKLDQLDQKIEDLKKSIPEQINQAVEVKWRSGVYSVVKWMTITVLATVIGLTVKMVIGG